MIGIQVLKPRCLHTGILRRGFASAMSVLDAERMLRLVKSQSFYNIDLSQVVFYLATHTNSARSPQDLIPCIKNIVLTREVMNSATIINALWLLKQHSHKDLSFHLSSLKRLENQKETLSSRSLGLLLDSFTNHSECSDSIIKLIQESIVLNEKFLSSIDLTHICRGYKVISTEETEDERVLKVIENSLLRMHNQMTIESIATCMDCISKSILRIPSDIPSMMEDHLASLIPLATPRQTCRILSLYSTFPLFYHYHKIYTASLSKILENPLSFFDQTKFYYVSVIHTFSKLKGYPEISELYPQHLPVIPEALFNDKGSFEIYLYSALRKKLTEEYDEYLVKVFYDNLYRISEFRKKKIVLAMALRDESENLFWRDVDKIGVEWVKGDSDYDIAFRYKKLLETYGLKVE